MIVKKLKIKSKQKRCEARRREGSSESPISLFSPRLCQDVFAKTSPAAPPSSSLKCTKWIIHKVAPCPVLSSVLSPVSNPCWVGAVLSCWELDRKWRTSGVQWMCDSSRGSSSVQHAFPPDTQEEDQRSDAQRPLPDQRREPHRRQDSFNDVCHFRQDFHNKARWSSSHVTGDTWWDEKVSVWFYDIKTLGWPH